MSGKIYVREYFKKPPRKHGMRRFREDLSKCFKCSNLKKNSQGQYICPMYVDYKPLPRCPHFIPN